MREAQVVKQAVAADLDQIQHFLEGIHAERVGVGDFPSTGRRRQIEEQAQALLVPRGAERKQVCVIATVHGQHVLELAEIRRRHLAGTQERNVNPAAPAGIDRARIGRQPNVPGARRRAVDSDTIRQAGSFEASAEHAFRRGGPTNVPEANKQYLDQFLGSPIASGTRQKPT